MKKVIYSTLLVILCCALVVAVFVACNKNIDIQQGGNDLNPDGSVSISIVVNGQEVNVLNTNADSGVDVLEPLDDITTNSSSSVYFAGYYLDPAFTIPVTNETKFSSNTNVYAKVIDVSSDTFRFTRSGEGVTITGLKKPVNGELIIPFAIDNAPVVAVASGAFKNNSSITSLRIVDVPQENKNTISGVQSIGDNAFEGCNNLATVSIPESVSSVGKDCFKDCKESIYKIDSNAYYLGNSSNAYTMLMFPISKDITSFSIVSGVKNINQEAFKDCTKLTSISIPNNVLSVGARAFSGCSALANVSIANGAKIIGSGAFQWCTKLTSISIPASIENISEYIFNGCTALTSITFANAPTAIGKYAFYGCSALKSVAIPTQVETIEMFAFSNTGLTSLNIPANVSFIGESIINGCTSLSIITVDDANTTFKDAGNAIIDIEKKEIIAGCKSSDISADSTVESIGYKAFEGCVGLSEISVPSNIITIGAHAFENCSNVSKLTFATNSNIATIGGWAFSGCTSLTTINGFANSGQTVFNLRTIDNYAFSNCGITNLTIPDSIKLIGAAAFRGCNALESITIPFIGATPTDTSNTHLGYIFGAPSYRHNGYFVPETLKTITLGSGNRIGAYAFYDCVGATTITLSDQVAEIGDYAFYNCSSLTNLTVPSAVTRIGVAAFYDCTKLNSFTFKSGSLLASIDDNAFYNCIELPEIAIPDGVARIGDGAFYNCIKLASANIPTSATYIGAYAFYKCDKITSALSIPVGVETIGDGAFYDCSGFSAISFANGCVLKSIGNNAFYNCNKMGNVSIPNGTVSIGDGAFAGCSTIGEIVIPASVTSIGKDAFDGCSGMTKVRVGALNSWCATVFSTPKSNPLYYAHILYVGSDQGQTTDLKIPTGVTSIGDYVFYGCNAINKITIPAGVTSIGRDAFAFEQTNAMTNGRGVHISDLSAWCETIFSTAKSNPLYYGQYLYVGGANTATTALSIPTDVDYVADYAFVRGACFTSLTIPQNIEFIGTQAFYDCENIKSVTFGGSSKLLSIGDSAFEFCFENIGDNSVSITIPESVTHIGQAVFKNCTKLESVTFKGNNFTAINNNTFYNCTKLASITIPDAVKEIGNNAFYNCTAMTQVTIFENSELKTIGDNAFYECTGITSIRIPSGTTNMGSFAFYNCQRLATVTMDSTALQLVGTSTFDNCKNLTSITIPATVISIGDSAFLNCEALTSVTFSGNKVESIGKNAFENCLKLESIAIPSSVKVVGDTCFSGCTSLKSVGLTSSSALVAISARMFNNCTSLANITIPLNVTEIGNRAFYNCTALKGTDANGNLSLPSGIISIGNSAFYNCYNVSGILTIQAKVASIGDQAFYNMYNLSGIKVSANNAVYSDDLAANDSSTNNCLIDKSAGILLLGCKATTTIPEGVVLIADHAFRNCALTSIHIPSTVSDIGEESFWNCQNSLTSITVSSSNTIYASHNSNTDQTGGLITKSGRNCIVHQSTKTLILGCRNTIIPTESFTTSIAANAFYNCTSLSYIVLPAVITSVGESAFYNCTGLSEVFTYIHRLSDGDRDKISVGKNNDYFQNARWYFYAAVNIAGDDWEYSNAETGSIRRN